VSERRDETVKRGKEKAREGGKSVYLEEAKIKGCAKLRARMKRKTTRGKENSGDRKGSGCQRRTKVGEDFIDEVRRKTLMTLTGGGTGVAGRFGG